MPERACKIANQGCRAPAGYGVGGGGFFEGEDECKHTCAFCREPVCANPECSKLRVLGHLLGHRRRYRICFDCFELAMSSVECPYTGCCKSGHDECVNARTGEEMPQGHIDRQQAARHWLSKYLPDPHES